MADPNDPWADDARRDDPFADDRFADDPRDGAAGGPDPDRGDGPHADLGTYASDRDVLADNPKKGVGTGVKVLVGLLIAGGLACLVCCGSVWMYVSSISNNAVDAPAAVRARTDEILTVDIPETFEPDGAFRMSAPPVVNWFFDFTMDIAGYGTEGGGQLIVVKFAGPPGMSDGASPEEMKGQVETQMQSQNGGGVRVNVESSETRTYNTADGRGVDWQFAKGTGVAQDGTTQGPYRQVRGALIDGDDVYVIQLAVPEEEYDEAAVVAMLKSIRLVDPQTEPVPADAETPLRDPAAEGEVVEPGDDPLDGDPPGDEEVPLVGDDAE